MVLKSYVILQNKYKITYNLFKQSQTEERSNLGEKKKRGNNQFFK